MRTVLIISPHFPPINAADCHRVRMVLPFLHENGWNAEVLAVEPQCVAAPMDPWLAEGIPDHIPIHRVRALSLQWSRIPGLGILDFRALRALRKRGNELLASGRFDLVYFSTTVFGVHVLGPEWKRRFSVDFVMDYQDPWVGDFYRQHPEIVPPGGRLKFAVIDFMSRTQEPRVLRSCAGITSVSPAYPEQLRKRYHWLDLFPVKVLPFPGSTRDLDRVRHEQIRQQIFDPNDGNRHWLYVGRGGDDMEASLAGLFKALSSWKSDSPNEYLRTRLHFIGTSYAKAGCGKETVRPLAEKYGVADVVNESTDRIPYSVMLNCLDQAHGLLIIGSSSPAYTASKLYPYLLARKPLLAIFRRESSVVQIVQDVGGAHLVTFDEGSSIDQIADGVRAKWIDQKGFDTLVPMDGQAFEPYTDHGSARQLTQFFVDVLSKQAGVVGRKAPIAESNPDVPTVPALVMGLGIDFYGKEKRMIRMISKMKRLNPLFMISSWDRGVVAKALTDHGMRYRKASFGYLGLVHLRWTLINISRMPILFWKVLVAGHEHRAKLLVFAELFNFLNAFPVFAFWRLASRVRIVFYLGDIGGRTVLQRFILRLADRFADVFIVNSQAVSEGIRKAGVRRTPVHVVYNGVDLAAFSLMPSKRSLKTRAWTDEHLVFGYVGQLKENKGIADFLSAARLVAATHSDVRFLVVGECPQKSDYPQQLREQFADLGDKVRFVGFVDDMPACYQQMDVVVVPSRHADPAPNVNLEAMASSLPVIATNVGGSPELIEDGVTGLLTPPCDAETLALKMRQLCDDPHWRLELGRQGRIRCESLFDAQKNALVVESLIIGAPACFNESVDHSAPLPMSRNSHDSNSNSIVAPRAS